MTLYTILKVHQRVQTLNNCKEKFNLGGGSALLPLPIDIISLEEKLQIIKLLQSKGANIQELNTVRQSISQLKNGGLVRTAKAQTVSKCYYVFIFLDDLYLLFVYCFYL